MEAVRVKKSMLGFVLGAVMLLMAAPGAAFASTSPQCKLGTMKSESGTYSFPDATVTGDVKTMTVSITGAGSITNISGATFKDATNTSATFTDTSAEAAQAKLRGFTFTGCNRSTKIEVTVDGNETDLPDTATSVSKVGDHYYMFIPGKDSGRALSWSACYNLAKKFKYNGMQGYLATLTSQSEYKALHNRVSSTAGWIGGTLMVYANSTKISDASSLDRAPSLYTYQREYGSIKELPEDKRKAVAIADYYWACGPEAGESLVNAIEAGLDTGSDVEPNAYMHIGSDKPWEGRTDVLQMTKYECCLVVNNGDDHWVINDITEPGCKDSGYADGFFVEFGGYAEGTDPGKPDTSLTSTDSKSFAHEHSLHYIADGNVLRVTCANSSDGLCDIPAGGLTLTLLSGSKAYDSKTVNPVVGTTAEREAWEGAGLTLPAATITHSETQDGTYTEASKIRNAGYYKLKLTIDGTSVESTYSISQKQVYAVLSLLNKTYDGSKTMVVGTNAGWMLVDNIEGDDLGVTANAEFSSEKVGNYCTSEMPNFGIFKIYNVKLTGDDACNYWCNSVNCLYAQIIAREVTLTWGDTSLGYTGSAQAPTCEIGNIVEGESVGVTVDGAQTEVGSNYTATASLSGADDVTSNYTLPDNKSVTFSIKSAIAPKVSIEGWTYGEDAKTPMLADGSNPGDGKVTYEYAKQGESNWSTDVPTNAGSYTVRATIAETDGYKGGTATADFKITKASIASASVVAGEQTYTGSELTPAPTVTLNGKTLSSDTDYTVSYSNNINAGTATVTVTGVGNYTGDAKTTFTIAQADISSAAVTVPKQTYVYTGSSFTPEPTVTLGGKTLKADTDYTVSYSNNVNAGTATLTVVGTGNYVGAVTVSFTIERAAITPEVSIKGWTYGQTANTPSVADSTNPGKGNVSYEYRKKNEAAWFADVPCDAGEYIVKATVAETDNYKSGTATAEFTIAKANITPEVSITGWTYSNPPNAPSVTEASNPGKGEVSYTYRKKNETMWSEVAPKDAGDYTVKATVAETGNYKSGTATAEFTIAPADIDSTYVEVPGQTYIYTGSAFTPMPTVYLGDKTLSADTDYTVSYSNNVNAGTATITLTGKGNYTGTTEKNFTIERAAIAPKVSIKGWTYGEDAKTPVLADGSNPGDGKVTYEYAKQGEDTWSGAAPTNAGNYTVRATVAETANYEGGIATADFSIAAADIASATVTVLEQTYTGSELTPAPMVTLGGKTLEADTDYTVSYANNVNAGTATVKVTGTGNYMGTASASFTIARAAIAPKVSIESWTFGEDANAPSLTDGSNPGDGEVTFEYAKKVEEKSKSSEETWSTTVPTDAGNYTVRATIAETANYEGGTATADFTIAKASIAPAVSLEGWTYGEDAKTPVLADGSNPGDGKVTYGYAKQGEDTWSGVAPTNAGNYTVRATVAETANYEGGTATAEFTIAPALITSAAVVVPEQIYTGSELTPSPTVTLGGKTLEADADYTVLYANNVNAGTATVKVTGIGNYMDTATADFTIARAAIAPKVSIEGWTFGEDASAPSLADGSNPGDGEVTFEYAKQGEDTWSADAPTSAGDYTVKATVAETANYERATATTGFSIAPKSIKGAKVVLGPSLTANDQEQEQTIESVTLADGTVLTADDFTVVGNKVTAAGNYTLTITGAGNYTGSVEVDFTVAAKPDQDDKKDEGDKSKQDDKKKEDGKKNGSKKEKLVGTGDNSTAAIAAAVVAGISLAAAGIITRRRNAA